MESNKLLSELKKTRGVHNLSVSDLVSIDALELEDIELLFKLSAIFQKFIAAGNKKHELLYGKTIVNFFNEASTRTRTSFELAGKQLGADVVNVSESGSSVKKGETIGDTARTLDALGIDLLVVRDAASGAPYQLSKLIGAPVVNAGDGWHEHPTQALLNGFTLREIFGKKKLTYLFIGDALHSRVFGSEVRLYQKLGYEIRLAAPATLVPKDVEKFGVKVFHNLEKALPGADVVHTIRLQTERAAGKFVATGREYSKNYCLNPARAELMKRDGVIIHVGPVIREFDIQSGVLESKRCIVQQLVENGLPLRMALLWLLITNPKQKANPWKTS